MPLSLSFWWSIPLLMTMLVGIICPATGAILITHKRLLQANLISHSVLPGLALAIAIGVDPAFGGVISGLVGALIAEKLALKKSENNDAVINTVLAGSLGLGVLLIPLLGIRIDLEAVLFGDLLTASLGDLFRMIIAAIILIVFVKCSYMNLIYIGLDPDGAEAIGLNVSLFRIILGFVTSFVVVSSMAAVGIVLVIGLLSAPAVLGLNQAKSLGSAMLRSSIIGVLLSMIGFFSSISFNLSPGPLISILCIISLAFWQGEIN